MSKEKDILFLILLNNRLSNRIISNNRFKYILKINRLTNIIKPDLALITSVKIVKIEGKEVIKIELLKGTKRPYHLIAKGLKPSGVFVRHGITSAPATLITRKEK